jgi:hypothetical protein
VSDRDTVLAAVERINASWTSGDPDAIAASLRELFDGDIVIRGPRFAEMGRGRTECIASYVDFARAARVAGFEMNGAAVDVFGDLAVATYEWTIAYTLEGTDYRERGYDAFAFRREGSRWVAVWRVMLPSKSETDS